MYGSNPTSTANSYILMDILQQKEKEIKDICDKYAFYIYECLMSDDDGFFNLRKK